MGFREARVQKTEDLFEPEHAVRQYQPDPTSMPTLKRTLYDYPKEVAAEARYLGVSLVLLAVGIWINSTYYAIKASMRLQGLAGTLAYNYQAGTLLMIAGGLVMYHAVSRIISR